MRSVDRSFKLITSNNAFDNRATLISGQAVSKKNGVQGDEVSKKQLDRLTRQRQLLHFISPICILGDGMVVGLYTGKMD
jgi:hypothetical protein